MHGQTAGFIAPPLLLLTLPPVLVLAGLESPDPNPVLNLPGPESFLLCTSHPLSPKSRTQALGCIVLCSPECACVRPEAVLQPWRGMDSRGAPHLEVLRTWRLLTSALRVVSCSLSSCSPAAVLWNPFLADVRASQMCSLFLLPGDLSSLDPTGTGEHREHLSKLQKGTEGVCHLVAVEAQDGPALNCCMTFCPSGPSGGHNPLLVLLHMKKKTCSYGEGWSWGILVPSDRSSCLEPWGSY